MADPPLQRPVPLTLDQDCGAFDCGSEPLNTYLKRFAWTNQQAGAARTYVVPARRDNRVVGYYTLVYGSVHNPRRSVSERVWPDIQFPSWCWHAWPSIEQSKGVVSAEGC